MESNLTPEGRAAQRRRTAEQCPYAVNIYTGQYPYASLNKQRILHYSFACHEDAAEEFAQRIARDYGPGVAITLCGPAGIERKWCS